jgi:hypothetical protein
VGYQKVPATRGAKSRPVNPRASPVLPGNKRGTNMKKKVQTIEVDDEGLVGLMGERVTLFCLNYFYTGELVGVNDTCVLLEDAAIVFDTGSYKDKDWADAQKLPHPIYVMTSAIEAFGIVK